MSQVCALFGISRQAVYQQRAVKIRQEVSTHCIVQMVQEQRRWMPKLGGKKLYWKLAERIHALEGMSIGRDKFFDILRNEGLLVRRKKKYALTTNAHHRFRVYKNLIRELDIDRPNQVFVSDITYLRLREGFCYLALVTDVYSRKIVGYDVSRSLSLEGALRAMKMALSGVPASAGLIHHSDRGIQYCSDAYISLLQKHQIQISMGECGNPYENAIAERVNGILKTEFLLDGIFTDMPFVQQAVKEAIETYNTQRPHLSLNFLTPEMKYAA